MHAAVLVAGDAQVAGDRGRLGDRGVAADAELGRDGALVHVAAARERAVLAVQRERDAERAGVLEGAPQEPGALDGAAVVREAGGAEVGEHAHLGQLGALEPARDGRHEADRHAGLERRALEEGLEQRGRVEHGVRVRHREHGAVAAGGGRGRAGREVLLVLLARRAQVDVRVDEAGEHGQALAVDDLRAGGRVEIGAERRDEAVADEQVVAGVEAFARVVEPHAAHEHGRGGAGPLHEPRRHQATASAGSGATGASRRGRVTRS